MASFIPQAARLPTAKPALQDYNHQPHCQINRRPRRPAVPPVPPVPPIPPVLRALAAGASLTAALAGFPAVTPAVTHAQLSPRQQRAVSLSAAAVASSALLLSIRVRARRRRVVVTPASPTLPVPPADFLDGDGLQDDAPRAEAGRAACMPPASSRPTPFSGSRADWLSPDVPAPSPARPQNDRPLDGPQARAAASSPRQHAAFAHMRQEFTNADGIPDVRADGKDGADGAARESQAAVANTANTVNTANTKATAATGLQIDAPLPLSGAQVVRRVMGLPMFVVRDVVLPCVQVALVCWWDVKVLVVDRLEHRCGFFLSDAEVSHWSRRGLADGGRDAWPWRGEGESERVGDGTAGRGRAAVPLEELSEEEKLVLGVEQSAKRAAAGVQYAFRKLVDLF